MTHDELLAKLWILPANVTELQHGAKAVHALRAVVELHKPFESNIGFGKDIGTYCAGCDKGIEEGFAEYPCPTIQAIEKELQ